MRKMSKFLVLMLILVMGISMVGCSSDPAEENGAKADDQLVIGYTVQSLENAYFISVVEGMEKAAKEMGITLIVADAGGDAIKHVDHIENFIAQGVDAILISPVDQEAPKDVVKKAQDAGIPVVSMNQKVEGSSAFIGTSEYEFGFLGGVSAGNWLNDKEADGTINQILNDAGEIEVVVIRYDVIASLIDRGDGLKDGLTETYTGSIPINFVFEQDAADADTGFKLAETALTANPKVSIFLGINDSSALGVYESLLARKNHTVDNTCITGLDALPEALKLIAGDTMFVGTVDIQPLQTGKNALEIVQKVLADGPITDQIIIEMKVVNDENISEYVTN
jgi:ABC-type sugar transport system substrate-binding protein